MLTVLKAGLLTTVQDLGREGCRARGVPVAGAMDRYSFQAANLLAGNAPDAAAIEMTHDGGSFRFESDALVAVCGAEMHCRLDGKPVRNWSSLVVPSMGVLDFGAAARGCRAYLAVHGGIAVPPVLGSRSTYLRGGFGGFEGRALLIGDRMNFGEGAGRRPGALFLPSAFIPHYGAGCILRVMPGPQDDLFTDAGVMTFFNAAYRVTGRNDRMGYVLDGPAVNHRDRADIVSDALCAGVVQVPGDGRPIIMTADAQTTGGYAKIGTVIGPDLPWLVQAREGNTVRFVWCGEEQALAARRAEQARYEEIGLFVNGD